MKQNYSVKVKLTVKKVMKYLSLTFSGKTLVTYSLHCLRETLSHDNVLFGQDEDQLLKSLKYLFRQ